MFGWIIFFVYAAVGVSTIPLFAKQFYKMEKPKWHYRQDSSIMAEASWVGFFKSIFWPITLLVYWAVQSITSEQRAIEAEKSRKLEVSEARKIIARYEKDEHNKWADSFKELEGKPKKKKDYNYDRIEYL